MSLSPIKRLPPELLDHILKSCNCSRSTLSCSRLVCKSWASSAEPLLFDRLRIRTRLNNEHCEKILAQTDSNIVHYIRHISFEDVGHKHNLEDLLQYFQDIVARLKDKGASRIRSLGLHLPQSPLASEGSTFLTFLSSSFPNIIELNTWFDESNLGSIVRFMCSFSQLENLGVSFYSGLEEPPSSQSLTFRVEPISILPKSLKSFHCVHPFDENTSACFNNWLSSQPPRSVLEISVLWTLNLNMQSYSTLCSETLKTLLVTFGEETETLQECDLSRLRVLEVLTLNVGDCHDFPRFRVMLETLRSANLRRIEFVVEPYPEYERAWPDDHLWEELDPILASDKFKSVTIEMHLILVPSNRHRDVSFKDAEEHARNLLKSCHTQGRLSVVPLFEDDALIYWTVAEERRIWLGRS
ncbi:hypothetical protein L218DRAFT_965569 [Marasmius fiardii PR-910]|nr:hypothetical protein L218DRAFT_965569 [Marasmius fiardii PR-910]